MKKLKLFLSICTLCLCFAVLCMGIYAAQSVSYTISGTISYTVEDVFATISAKVFKVSGQQSASMMQTNVDTLSTTSLSSIASSTYIDAGITITDFDTTSSSSESRNVDITIDNTYMTYYIVVNIANLADRAINAMLTDSTTYANLNTASKLIQNNIAKGETKNLVVAFSLDDNKVEINSLEINYKVEVGYTEYTTPVFGNVALKNDETNKYWYVELGQLSSSDATKLKWRLVSLNGTSAYTYSTTTPTVGSGSVFVQETALTNNSVEWGSSYSNTNYFTESTLRTSIKDGGLFNLSDTEKDYLTSGYIEARTLDDISWSYMDYQASTFTYPYTDSSHTALTSSSKGTDYFWLMSVDEACLYFNDPLQSTTLAEYNYRHTNIQWKPSGSGVSFWLRSPCYHYDFGDTGCYGLATCVSSDGSFYDYSAGYSCGVRAAFQLA